MTSIASALNLGSIWLAPWADLDPGGSVEMVSVQEADLRPTPPSSLQFVGLIYYCGCGVRIELA